MNKPAHNSLPLLIFSLIILLLPAVIGYAQAPVITNVSPVVGRVGSSVVITGHNFDAAPTNNVVFFGASAASVVAADTNQLTVTVDTGATYAPVSVLNNISHLTGYQGGKYLPTFNSSYFRQDTISIRNITQITVGLANSLPYQPVIGDLDGDGKPDIVVNNRHSSPSLGTISVFRNVSSPGWISNASFAAVGSSAGLLTAGNQPANVKLSDLDGDGMLDIVVSVLGTARIAVFRNTSTVGNISFDAIQEFSTVGYGIAPYVLGIADFDNDGKPDVAVTCRDSANVVLFHNASAVGAIDFTTVGSFPCGLMPIGICTGDFDRDGLVDIGVADDSSETVSVLKNVSIGNIINFAPRIILSAPGKTSDIQSVDIDGDGRLDIVVSNTSDTTISLYRNVSMVGTIDAFSFEPNVDFQTLISPTGIGIGDLNGDGRPDLVVANADLSSNKISIFRNAALTGALFTSATLISNPVNYATGLTPLGVSLGDLDGDGYPEIVVANNTAGRLTIFRDYPLPPVGSITGAATICYTGPGLALADSVTGGFWRVSNPALATINSNTGFLTPIHAGLETVFYSTVAGGDTNTTSVIIKIDSTPYVSAITGPTSHCAGTSITLTNTVIGGVWQSSNPAVATVTPLGTTDTVTGLSAGIAVISYSISNACGTATDTLADTIKTIPFTDTITGTAAVCGTNTTTLHDTVSGGLWSIQDPSIATINSSGLVTGITPGNTTISYTLTNSCGTNSATVPFVVNVGAVAGTIAGPTAVCEGATISLSGVAPGGVWSSSNAARATVNSSGFVTGLSGGTTVISYTVANSCNAVTDTQMVTVNPLPQTGTVTGPTTVCQGSTVNWVSTVTGGTWTSNATSIATINSTSGMLGGASVGTATISYIVSNGCGSSVTPRSITVAPLPQAGTITGTTAVCTGLDITLTNTTTGGAWSSSNSAKATVAAGTVHGISLGNVIISYSVTNSCGTATDTQMIVVNPQPNAGTITGATSVCAGANIALSNTATGGAWSSNATGTASVVAGVVHGVSAGDAIISYTHTNSCGTAVDTQMITVMPLANAGIISGPTAVCAGSDISLSETVTGGTWTGSNNAVATVSGGVVSGVSAGNVIISYSVSNGCGTVSDTQMVRVNPLPNAGTILGAHAVCTGFNTNLTNTASGGTWTTSDASIASVAGGVVHGAAVGTAIISYTVTNSCGTAVDTQRLSVNLTPDPGTITGGNLVCEAAVITLSNTATGGMWTSGNTAIATVSGGTVGGVVAGTAIISYSVTNGCGTFSDTQMVRVNPLLNAGTLSGVGVVCTGNTINVIPTVAGGTWSATNNSASVSGGVVTGNTAGTDTIAYTVTNSCGTDVVTKIITINLSPNAGTIVGLAAVCAGQVITLTDTASGGTWTASNTHASVSGGVVTGISSGTTTISYTVANGCGTLHATHFITIDTLPPAGTITGPPSVCVGNTIPLGNAVTGGIWTATNANATVVAGVVTGVAIGTDTIQYSTTNGCGSNTVVKEVIINNTPYVDTITGMDTVCEGVTVLFSNTVAGGTWSSSNSTVASIDATGLIMAMSGGTATITYSVSSSCGTVAVHKDILVHPLPIAGTITGGTHICIGSSITLTDTVISGTWSAANALATVAGGVVTGVAAGVDTISYTVANGCGIRSAVHIVIIDALPDTGAITGASSLCSTSTMLLADTVSGGVWSSSNTAVATVSPLGLVTGMAAGVAVISYTVGSGCNTLSARHTITVKPVPALTSTLTPNAVCDGLPFSYLPASTVPGSNITWFRSTVPGISNAPVGGATAISEMLHDTMALPVVVPYSITISADGCSDTITVTVTINPTPRLASSLTHALCGGVVFDYTPISATLGVAYTWSRAAVAGVAPATATGTGAIHDSVVNSTGADVTVTYLYTITANTCTNTQAVTLILSPGAHMPHITTQSPSVLCTNAMYQNFGTTDIPYIGEQFTWSAANAAIWATGSGAQYCAVNFTQPGFAWVYLTATLLSSGCAQRDSFAVSVQGNISDQASVVYQGADFICTPSTEDSYQWGYDDATTLDSTILTGETNQNYYNSSPDNLGKYYWVITTHNGCMQKTYYKTPTKVSVVSSMDAASLHVLPNPNNGSFTCSLLSVANEPVHISITNLLGQVVKEWTTTTNKEEQITLNTSSGIYLLSATTKDGKYTQRVVAFQ